MAARTLKRRESRVKHPITRLKGMFSPTTPEKLAADTIPVSVGYLRELHRRIDLATGAAAICAAALREQMTGFDLDVAALLRHCVNNLLADDLEKLDDMIPGGAA